MTVEPLSVRRCAHVLLVAAVAALAGCGGGGSGGGGAAVFLPAASPAPFDKTPVASAQIDAAVAKLDGLADEVMRRTKIPGMAVAVVKDGQVVYAKGFGVRRVGSPEQVDADTVFQLASMSKPM